jgi:hypothetical protein
MNDTKLIARYILGTANSIDGRGAHQNEMALLSRLVNAGTPFVIAQATAQACRVVGQAIAKAAKP